MPKKDRQKMTNRTKKPLNEEVHNYIISVADDRRILFEKLQTLILRLYPDAEERLSYKIPTYKGTSGWVALGYWKGGVSLYTNGPHHIEKFRTEDPSIKTGKVSINFKITDTVLDEALEAVIHHAMKGLTEI
jgi:uncharacterized protein YdhG (YjbR/CyaY superfamily)